MLKCTNEAAIEKFLEIANIAIINRPMKLQLYYLPQKRAPLFVFFYKTRANAQQVLPVQTGLYRYDEWMV